MTRKELIEYCLTYPTVYEDYPFDDVIAVIRHSNNNKIFAMIFHRNDIDFVNLKCDPTKADFLRNIFKGVTPGYHMNKTHWNTVLLDSDVPNDELYNMIQESFDLTKPKTKRKNSKKSI